MKGAPNEFGLAYIKHITNNVTELAVTNAVEEEVEFFSFRSKYTSEAIVTTNALDEYGVIIPGGTSTNPPGGFIVTTSLVWHAVSPPSSFNGLESECWGLLG